MVFRSRKKQYIWADKPPEKYSTATKFLFSGPRLKVPLAAVPLPFTNPMQAASHSSPCFHLLPLPVGGLGSPSLPNLCCRFILLSQVYNRVGFMLQSHSALPAARTLLSPPTTSGNALGHWETWQPRGAKGRSWLAAAFGWQFVLSPRARSTG